MGLSIGYNIREMYIWFLHKKYTSKIPQAKYHEFLKKANELVASKLLKGEVVELPYNLGSLAIEGNYYAPTVKNNILYSHNIDFPATQKLRMEIDPNKSVEDWKEIPYPERPFVYYDNDHTGDYKYKCIWHKGIIKGCSVYQFKANRQIINNPMAILLKEQKVTYRKNQKKANEQRKICKPKPDIRESIQEDTSWY